MGIAHRHVSVLAWRHDDALRDCASGVAVKLMRAQIIRILRWYITASGY